MSSLVFKTSSLKDWTWLVSAETGRAIDGDICFREGYDNVSSKYSPDCCQHELLFLLLLLSRRPAKGLLLTQIGLVACQVSV